MTVSSKLSPQGIAMSDEGKELQPTVCGWQEDENGDNETDCGNVFSLISGTPPENDMKYCPYCGKLIAWCSYSEPEDKALPVPERFAAHEARNDEPKKASERPAPLAHGMRHCPTCGEELGEDGHHKPDPAPLWSEEKSE